MGTSSMFQEQTIQAPFDGQTRATQRLGTCAANLPSGQHHQFKIRGVAEQRHWFSVAEKAEVEFWYVHANKPFFLAVRSIRTAEPPLLSSGAATNPCLLPPLAMYSSSVVPH